MISSTMNTSLHWTRYTPSIRMDIFCLIVAVGVHAPLYFMRFQPKKSDFERKHHERILDNVKVIDELPKKEETPAPPPPAEKKAGLMDKLKLLVKKEPPPPPPPKIAKVEPPPPPKLETAPKEIKIEPKVDLTAKLAPKLESKSGFKTTLDAKLVQEKQISLKAMTPAIAPLSASKLGTVENRSAIADKGNFKISKADNLHSIGGSAPGLSGASAPTIALPVAAKGSREGFSAPPPQVADKGKLGAMKGVPGLGASNPNLGIRDTMIAKYAAPAQISNVSSGGRVGGVAGGVEGGVGTKKDAGRFNPSAGSPGGIVGGTGSAPASGLSAKISAQPVVKHEKKSMFVITGQLKDRKIQKQVLPEYPEWAQAKGIEAAVILQFTVDVQGNVKDNVVVIRTSGYPKLDESAIQTLKKWRFEPLSGDQNREEVGQITFNYSLS